MNGIRAAMNKDFVGWLHETQPDVLCIQENKAQPEQIDDAALQALGYHVYWHSAQKKGYSGVGILCKQKPLNIVYGCGLEKFDQEGRIIRVDFEEVSILSVYVPSASNIERLDFKMEFCEAFLLYVKTLQKTLPALVICGDFNICHEAIDIHDPIRLSGTSGFLPIERDWLSRFMNENQMLDSFRHLNKEAHQYSWWSYRANARNNNKGWRIDYAFASQNLEQKIKKVYLLNQAKHSDHCPVGLELG